MDKNLQAAIERFLNERVTNASIHSSPSLCDALSAFCKVARLLKETLSQEQLAVYRECENAFSLLDGQTQYDYYRAGFSDAVSFLLTWRDYDGTEF